LVVDEGGLGLGDFLRVRFATRREAETFTKGFTGFTAGVGEVAVAAVAEVLYYYCKITSKNNNNILEMLQS
jgi:hypothetical protein